MSAQPKPIQEPGNFRVQRPTPHRLVRGSGTLRQTLIPGLVAAVLMGFGVVATNRFGVAVTPDSAHYLSAARNLATGYGLRITQVASDAPGMAVPYTAWPPLYPVLVSGAVWAGLDVLTAAVVVNAAAMVLLAIAVAGLAGPSLRRNSRFGVLLALSGMPALYEISAFAWSEGVFLAFTYLAFWLLALALPCRGGRREWAALGGAGIALGLSTATRYLGLGAVAAAGLALLVYHGGRSFRYVMPRFLAVTGPAAVFAGVWFARNLSLTGNVAGQPRLAPQVDLPGICASMAGFLIRDFAGDHPAGFQFHGLPVRDFTLLLFGFAVALLLMAGGKRLLRTRYERLEPIVPVLLPMVAFVLVYYPGLAVLGSQVHRLDVPDTRFLSAGYPALILLAAVAVDLARNPGAGLLTLTPGRGALMSAASVILIGLLWLGSARFIGSDDGASDGALSPYHRTRRWAVSDPAGSAAMTRLPPDRPVWTNVSEYVDLVAGRPARRLPGSGDLDALDRLAAHPGPVYVDTRLARGVLTREDLLSLSRRVDSPIHFEGDLGHVALFRVSG